MTLFWFLLPALLVLAVRQLACRGGAGARPAGLGAALVALAAALIPSLVVIRTAVLSSPWEDATQVAWIGLHAASPSGAVQVGGAPEQALIGWPGGQLGPSLALRSTETGTQLSVGGGEGFVTQLVGKEARPWNGATLAPGGAVSYGAYRLIRKGSAKEFVLGVTRGTAGEDLLEKAAPPARGFLERLFPPSRSFHLDRPPSDRVMVLRSLLGERLSRLRVSAELSELANELEEWSSDVVLQLGRKGDLRVAVPDAAPRSESVTLPARLRLRWPGASLEVLADRRADGLLELRFLPPWRKAAPLPPESGAGHERHLTFTSQPQPGDFAFVLPGTRGDERLSVPLVTSPEGRAVFGPPGTRTNRRDLPESVTSLVPVPLGAMRADAATVRNLPNARRMAALFGTAVLLFLLGLVLARPGLTRGEHFTLAALSVSLFSLLSVRTLLALRYGLDPSRLDAPAVKGVALAFWGLAVGPAALFLTTRLWRDRLLASRSPELKARTRWTLAYAFLVAAIAHAMPRVASTLWSGAPDYAGAELDVLVSTITILTVLHLGFRLVTRPNEPGHSGLRALFLGPLALPHRLVTRTGARLFLWASRDTPGSFLRAVVVVAVGALGTLAMLVAIDRWVLHSGQKVVQEILAPAAFCWVPALLWLAARQADRTRLAVLRVLALAGSLIVLPIFVVPLLLDDPGGMVSTFSLFASTLVLLCVAKPRKLGALGVSALLLALVAAGLLYLNLESVLPYLPKRAQARVLVFKEGSRTQERMPFAGVLGGEKGLRIQPLQDALVHTWANRAIAQEGGLRGAGFGGAPTARAPIPQNVLQYDSTFSFFIVAEHGLAGGFLLLCAFAIPLALVLASGRPRFETGHAVAAMVAGTLVLEALFHAGMNLGTLPFSGRNLPLLSAHSLTDLVRWILLFALAAQALLWRGDAAAEDGEPRTVSYAGEPDPPSRRRYLTAIAWLSAVPVALFLTLLPQAVSIARGTAAPRTFTWGELMASVRRMIDRQVLRVDSEKQTLVLDSSALEQEVSTAALLTQEIQRFNALPLVERQGEKPLSSRAFAGVRSLEAYDQVFARLLARPVDERETVRPTLFRLEAPAEHADEEGRFLERGRVWRVEPNPDFNVAWTFASPSGAEAVPSTTYRDGKSGQFVLTGKSFRLPLPDDDPTPSGPPADVTLGEGDDGSLYPRGDAVPREGRVRLSLRFKEKRGSRETIVGLFASTPRHALFIPRPGGLRFRVQRASSGREEDLPNRPPIRLYRGDRLVSDGAVGKAALRLSFTVEESAGGLLVGPAWVMGRWTAAVARDSDVPWAAWLSRALQAEWNRVGPVEASKRYGRLTLDRELQALLNGFAAEKGRSLHAELLPLANSDADLSDVLPPRLAISALQLPDGETLALGGWPRMTSSLAPLRDPRGGGWLPPADWIERAAPARIRARYGGDRSFDRLEMGSATKPLWAAVVLSLHPGLEQRFRVRGPAGAETQVFGVPIPGKGWHVENAPGWVDLTTFLTKSNNRYQVRLGFLGLAEEDGGVAADGATGSDAESMDGGQTAWGKAPRFPAAISFSASAPGKLENLGTTPLAHRFRRLFAAGSEAGDFLAARRSFWTREEKDDLPDASEGPEAVAREEISARFRAISPQKVDLQLDWLRVPRNYVALLLGGYTNRWSNVDFAAAFGTAVTGRPVVAHVVRGEAPPAPLADRQSFPPLAARLRPGLAGVVESKEGTAYALLGPGRDVVHRLGVKVYGKTGTLALEEGQRETSRLVLALVRWQDEARGIAENGLVLSLVAERAKMGTASRLMGELLVRAEPQLARLLKAPAKLAPAAGEKPAAAAGEKPMAAPAAAAPDGEKGPALAGKSFFGTRLNGNGRETLRLDVLDVASGTGRVDLRYSLNMGMIRRRDVGWLDPEAKRLSVPPLGEARLTAGREGRITLEGLDGTWRVEELR